MIFGGNAMNIASLLLPRSMVIYLYEDYSIRQAIEKMKYHGYASMPVLTRDNQYVGTLTEGDLLWFLADHEDLWQGGLCEMEKFSIKEAMRGKNGEPVRIDAKMEDLIARAIVHDFVPVVDDRDSFIGIIKSGTILAKLAKDRKQLDYEEIFSAIVT